MVSPVRALRGFHKASIHAAYPQRIDTPEGKEGEKFNKGSADHRLRGKERSKRARRTVAESIGCSFRSSWSGTDGSKDGRWKINGGRKCCDRLEKGEDINEKIFLIVYRVKCGQVSATWPTWKRFFFFIRNGRSNLKHLLQIKIFDGRDKFV